ncbi:hypothetical protein [Pedobacter aquatilis]|nr:hypothetical protein [Pedobacter aquatilis]
MLRDEVFATDDENASHINMDRRLKKIETKAGFSEPTERRN